MGEPLKALGTLVRFFPGMQAPMFREMVLVFEGFWALGTLVRSGTWNKDFMHLNTAYHMHIRTSFLFPASNMINSAA